MDLRSDDADARLVVDVAASLRRWRDTTGKEPATRVLRETVWFFWQHPRLDRPLVASKYPRGALWSEEAALAAESGLSFKGELVIEHLEPMNRALRWLIDDAPTAQQVIDGLAGRLTCAVVTKDQSVGLPNTGSAEERYAAAGLDLVGFKPLDHWREALARQRGPKPAELGHLTVGDTRWDLMGREWTVVDLLEDGVVVQYADDEPELFTWHALMTIGACEEPPSAN